MNADKSILSSSTSMNSADYEAPHSFSDEEGNAEEDPGAIGPRLVAIILQNKRFRKDSIVVYPCVAVLLERRHRESVWGCKGCPFIPFRMSLLIGGKCG